ncbi:MAG: DNA polymerase III subunit epsilon [Nevskiaceae bacterium]|nr:MAG: DNA polymerase III subunit epsilon [Nevskiaceae bacterium]TBR74120.1 MAG: DNA polymerase III subunit epsilon [Nevskiaceae bacterium]
MSEARQVVLDTETTGLEVEQGHRVIEIGCVELRDRRLTGNNFHRYVNPERAVDEQAAAIHGLTAERLAREPVFAVLADDLWEYLQGAELIIHNAAFDVGFLDAEFARAGRTQKLAEACTVTDTVAMARKLHPGQRVNLDALCRRYGIDNSKRDLHGALLDAELLAEVYLVMTGGQASLGLERARPALHGVGTGRGPAAMTGPLPVVHANVEEWQRHRERLAAVARASGGNCLWADDLPAA